MKADDKISWSYTGSNGPEEWGKLSPEFSFCSCGKSQSPIDISQFEVAGHPNIIFNYKASAATVINNGHTIQANLADRDNSIAVDDVPFQLIQFHFHTPSEHTINGLSFPIELHLVHSDAAGNLAVVGVMMRNGAENRELSSIFNSKAAERESAFEDSFDISNLLPEGAAYYRYTGSLTTPPCTEGVMWIVLETPIEMSEMQIQSFKEIFPFNNRPIQPLNGRRIIKYVE